MSAPFGASVLKIVGSGRKVIKYTVVLKSEMMWLWGDLSLVVTLYTIPEVVLVCQK